MRRSGANDTRGRGRPPAWRRGTALRGGRRGLAPATHHHSGTSLRPSRAAPPVLRPEPRPMKQASGWCRAAGGTPRPPAMPGGPMALWPPPPCTWISMKPGTSQSSARTTASAGAAPGPNCTTRPPSMATQPGSRIPIGGDERAHPAVRSGSPPKRTHAPDKAPSSHSSSRSRRQGCRSRRPGRGPSFFPTSLSATPTMTACSRAAPVTVGTGGRPAVGHRAT